MGEYKYYWVRTFIGNPNTVLNISNPSVEVKGGIDIMAQNFNGRVIERPQAVAKVDVQGMIQANLASASIGYMIGSATGGQPQAIQWISSPSAARNVFRSGELVTALEHAFSPSTTPGINGASLIAAIRANPATQSTLILEDTTGTPVEVITLTSKDWGAWTEGIQVKIEAGSTEGVKITIKYGTDYEIGDNIGTNNNQVQAVVDWINANSLYITALKTATGNDILDAIDYTNLTGGADNVPTSQDWQDALDLLKLEDVNIGTVVTSDESIHAMLEEHCSEMSALGQKNRRGIVGHALDESVEDIIIRRENLLSQYMMLCSPGIKIITEDNETVTESAIMLAAEAVGIACAVEVKMPLTYKYVKCVGLEKNYTPDQLDELHRNNVMTVEYVPRKGYRITDDLMTANDDRYKHLSVDRIYDWLSINTTQVMEDYFVGQPGDDFAPGAMKSTIIESVLSKALDKGYIHGGVDPTTGQILPAYRNVSVQSQGETWIIQYEVSPTEQIGFVLIKIYAKRTNLVA